MDDVYDIVLDTRDAVHAVHAAIKARDPGRLSAVLAAAPHLTRRPAVASTARAVLTAWKGDPDTAEATLRAARDHLNPDDHATTAAQLLHWAQTQTEHADLYQRLAALLTAPPPGENP